MSDLPEDITEAELVEDAALTPEAPKADLAPAPASAPAPEAPAAEPAEELVEVSLRQQVILNGQRFGPGKCRIPAAAFDVWKNAL